VLLDDPPHDGEAEAGAALPGREEGLEDALRGSRGQARALVLDDAGNAPASRACRNPDRRSPGGELHRVGQQVLEDLLQASLVALDLGEGRREVLGQLDPGFAGRVRARAQGAADDGGDPAAHLNQEYKQEYYKGVAEDVATVIGLDQSVDVPYGSFTGCIKTEDRNPLESGAVEHKYYCSSIGITLEGPVDGSEQVELIDLTGP